MYCSACGTKLRDGAKFCDKCGAPVKSVNQEKPAKHIDSLFSDAIEDNNHKSLLPDVEDEYRTHKAESVEIEEEVPGTDYTRIYVTTGVICLVTGLIVGLVLSFGGVIRKIMPDAYGEGDDITSESVETPGDESLADDGFDTGLIDEVTNAVAGDTEEKPAIENDASETAQSTEEEPAEESTDPVALDESGIHEYELVIKDITWNEALKECENMGGYMLHINSQEEYDTVVKLLDEKGYTGIVYLGGMRQLNSNDYYWVDGAFVPTSDDILNREDMLKYWLKGEPSYRDVSDSYSVDEQYMCMINRKESGWVWNDIPDDVLSLAPNYYKGRLAFICEKNN